MTEFWKSLSSLFSAPEQSVAPIQLWLMLVAWVAWWLLGVNWKKAWPVLAQGGWAPVVLLMLTGALVWAAIKPSNCTCLGFMTIPNFWWQLGEVIMLAGLTLFCGWVQGYFGWAPAEFAIEPVGHDHGGHGHDHGSHDEHGHGHEHGGHEHGHSHEHGQHH